MDRTGGDVFARAAAHVLEREGGYVRHDDDPGGATRWGIAERTARAAGYRGAMTALPRERALAIYRAAYWDAAGLPAIAAAAPDVAIECFDTGVNCGAGTAARFLQRCLNLLAPGTDRAPLAVDGRLGPASAAALAAFLARRGREGEAALLRLLNALQGARYVGIAEADPRLRSFLYGWARTRL